MRGMREARSLGSGRDASQIPTIASFPDPNDRASRSNLTPPPPSYLAWPAYKEEGEGKLNSSEKRDCWDLAGNACKDPIVFFILSSQL